MSVHSSQVLAQAEGPSPASADVSTSQWEGKAASIEGTHDLRGRTVRGALASVGAQGAALILRTASIMVLSRLLNPRDFGLVAMATAVTGFLALFRDFGLSTASIQRSKITEAQVSGLFWLNIVAGGCLALACIGSGPFLARFYGEPRLPTITAALAAGFVFNGAAAQHRALLQRQLRFASVALIDVIGLIVAIIVSLSVAALGGGYWAVVTMAVCPQAVVMVGVWAATRWVPGRPRRNAGLRPLLKYGGTLTLNGFVVYLAFNLDKILLGRVWGADVLGLYSRAYQLMSLPNDGLSAAMSPVALPALARVQEDPERQRRYFLQGYAAFLTIAIPVAVACALFGQEIIYLFLGTKWHAAAGVFRLLTPTMLAFALINPLSWLLLSTGRSTRSLAIAFAIAPTVILGYSLGLPMGAQGVATGFSVAMIALVVPIIAWAIKGTGVTMKEIAKEIVPLLVAAAAGGGAAFVVASQFLQGVQPIVKLVLESAVLFSVFGGLVLFVFKDRTVYLGMLRDASRMRSAPGQAR